MLLCRLTGEASVVWMKKIENDNINLSKNKNKNFILQLVDIGIYQTKLMNPLIYWTQMQG